MIADYIATFLVQILLCFPAISLLLYYGLHIKHQKQQLKMFKEMFEESEQHGRAMSQAFWLEVRKHSETLFALNAAVGYPNKDADSTDSN